jgi:hypothetical protein
MGKSSLSSEGDLLDEINGFKVLPLHLTETLLHYIYFKRQDESLVSNSNVPLPPEKTLMMMNLPLGMTEMGLKTLFEHETGGHILHVIFKHASSSIPEGTMPLMEETMLETEWTLLSSLQNEPIPSSFHSYPSSIVYIVFKSEKSVTRALHLRKKKRTLSLEMMPFGLKRYLTLQSLRKPSPKILTSYVETFMSKFDQEQQSDLSSQDKVPDKDGFIKITRQKKKTFSSHPQISRKTDFHLSKTPSFLNQKLLPNFYKFQVRQLKQQQKLKLKQRHVLHQQILSSLQRSKK